MSTESQPDAPSKPLPVQRARKVSGYWMLAIELVIVLCIKGSDWVQQFQLRALLLDVHWSVLLLGWLVGVPVLYFLMIVTHEGGHVLGGRLARFRILSFAASWLHITRKAAGWEIGLKKPRTGLGGMVQATPTHTRHMRGRYSLFVAGGPVANLLSGALALYLHQALAVRYALPLLVSPGAYLLLQALVVFGWLSVVVGALNLIPRKLKSGHTLDGRHLWQFLQGGPNMHQQLALLYLHSLMYAGQRPREWDAAQVAQLVAHRSNSAQDCYAHLLAYAYFLDCHDLEQLRFHLNATLDSMVMAPVAVQQHVLGEAAYVAALLTHDTAQARYWLDRAQAAKPYTAEEGLFARAAVAYAEGQLPVATDWLAQATKQMTEALPSGGTIQAFDRIQDLQTRIEQGQRVPSGLGSEEAVAA